MVLARGPDPTIACVSDMEALARPRQGAIHHAAFGPWALGPGPISIMHEQMCMINDVCLGLARAAISDTNAMVGSVP